MIPSPAPRIALVVDHPRRDLAGIVLAAHELCQRGAVCYLVPLNLQSSELWALAPDVVVLNFMRRGIDELARKLLDAGITLAVLDTEGGVWADPDSYVELLWTDPALRARVSVVCLWGPAMATELIRRELLHERQVSVTGCPRFDLYHPVWRCVLASEPLGQRARILINTNFSFSNPRFVSVEQNRRQFREEFTWPEARIADYEAAEQAAIEGMIGLARGLAADFPALEVILRPHPFEDPGRYRAALQGAQRVVVDSEGPVQPQIFASTAVIQRSCSTAIESALAGVPALSPQWVPAPALIPMAERVSVPCASYEELRCVVESLHTGRFRLPSAVEAAVCDVIGAWFYRADGLAYQRVADAIMEVAQMAGPVNRARCRRELYGFNDAHVSRIGRAARRVRAGLNLSPDFSFRRLRATPPHRWAQSEKAFTVRGVEHLVRRIEAARAKEGQPVRAVGVESAAARADFLAPYQGYSVALWAPAAGGRAVRPAP